jgi:hypothetical protein
MPDELPPEVLANDKVFKDVLSNYLKETGNELEKTSSEGNG